MSQPAIEIEGLAKSYLIGHHRKQARYTALRDVAAEAAKNLWRYGLRSLRGQTSIPGNEIEEFWALKDVSLKIGHGEVVGIIGRNGAGKSTLLKILSRITEPTKGRVTLRGRVASLLEIGTGFHPELTGRENIFLNGSVLGMSRADIKQKFDEIVAFSEVEKFLDTPVKRYSSGMYVRLAFAVAAHLEPEILIVDEVLAVGDAEFQQKCLGRMKDVSNNGRTVIFVSHNLASIRSLCSRALVLRNGNLVFDGGVEQGSEVYSNSAERSGSKWLRPSTKVATRLMFTEIWGELIGKQPHLTLSVTVKLLESEAHPPAFVAFDIADSFGTVIMQALPRPDGFVQSQVGEHVFKVNIILPPLIPGHYSVSAWVGPSHNQTYDFIDTAISFAVEESPTRGRTFPHSVDHGFVVPHSEIVGYSNS